MTDAPTMQLEIGGFVATTAAEGPHARAAVWVQGCTLACPGCCNPELFERGLGRTVEVAALAEEIAAARRSHAIEGLTVLGGEPLEQLPAVTELCRRVAAMGLGVIVFTGFTPEEAADRGGFTALLPWVDTFVAGRFVAASPDRARAFIGSTNQMLVHRSRRYDDPALWHGPVYAEVIIGPPSRPDVAATAASATVVGTPALARKVARVLAR